MLENDALVGRFSCDLTAESKTYSSYGSKRRKISRFFVILVEKFPTDGVSHATFYVGLYWCALQKQF
jgi:hypothetical protein